MEETLKKTMLLFGLLVALGSASMMSAQQAGYSQTNLVSNTAGVATCHRPSTAEPLGYLYSSGAGFLDCQQ
jgi:hypothetical protein